VLVGTYSSPASASSRLIPHTLAWRLHCAGRIELALHSVGYPAPDDHEIFEHHRGRRLVELEARDLTAVSLGQHSAATDAEVGVQITSCGVDRIQPVAAIEEDAFAVPVAPVGDAAMLEPGRPGADRSALVGLRIERPEFSARLGIEGRHPRVHRGQVENAIDHDRSGLERTRPRLVFGERSLAGFPRPGDLQLADVVDRDLIGGGVLGVRLIRSDERPAGCGWFLPACDCAQNQSGGDKQGLHGTRSTSTVTMSMPEYFRWRTVEAK